MRLALQIAAGYFLGTLGYGLFLAALQKMQHWRWKRKMDLAFGALAGMQQADNNAQAAMGKRPD